jgi:hypothetical protein
MNVVPFDRAASDEATPSISSGSQQPTRGSAGDLRKRIRSLAERGKVRAARFVCRNAAGHRAIAGCETMRVTRAWLQKEPAQEGGCLCVVKRCGSSVGAIPTRQRSLQPVAIGAAVEVTKPSKPSRQHAAWRCGE